MNEASGAGRRPAGFWLRALALLVDLVLYAVVQFSLAAVAHAAWGPAIEDGPGFQVALALFTLLFTAVYTTVLHAAAGQTVGKLLAGVRVVDVDGSLLSPGAAFLRYLSYYLSVLTFGFGFLMAGLRRDKRALHDLVAGSRVERVPAAVRARPPAPPRAPALDAGVPPRA
ncbi:MAG TPA: RDD family protein [Methylomirabilota bacterium]|nr:RDD family protein [Methylomirabilota bacterium]